MDKFNRNLLIYLVVLFSGAALLGYVMEHDRKLVATTGMWKTSPCGTETFYIDYAFGRKFGGIESDYFDDGKKVWLKKIEPPKNDGDMPKYNFVLVMERTPEACAQWIKQTGIDLRNK